MSFTVEQLCGSPNPLAAHYTQFRVADRLLLTGHSHQAWPDRAFEAHTQAWTDAAEYVDDKWEHAFERAERVRAGFRRLLDDPSGHYSLGANTFELLVRLLSALPLRQRPRIVTTDSEFHSARRLLTRLEEEGVEIVRVAAHPAGSVGERLAAEVDERTAALLTSTVFFSSGHIAGALDSAADACRRHSAAFVLDVYHQLNVVPISLSRPGFEDAFVVGGGYKYCQLGEGNAFLRFPSDCRLRPVATGWFAEFGHLAAPSSATELPYNAGDDRFGGATYDPTSHYRGAAVFDFFFEHGLEPSLLWQVSRRQVHRLIELFDGLDLDPSLISRDRTVALEGIAGFLALRSPRADRICGRLRDRGVRTDHRGEVLRFGPAPYLSDTQLTDAMTALGEAAG
jgi:selenocysteine lyase/cysteine desulfurase